MKTIINSFFIILCFLSCNNQEEAVLQNIQKDSTQTKQNIISESTLDAPIKSDTNKLSELESTLMHLRDAPFFTEDSIIGKFIVTTSDSFKLHKKLKFYNQQGEIIYTIENLESDVITTKGKVKYSRNDTTNPLAPRVFNPNPDYFRLILDCNVIQSKYYEVIIDRGSSTKAYIKKSDPLFKLQTIEEHITEWGSIGIDFNRAENNLHEEPNSNSEIIHHNLEKKYKIWQGEFLKISGDWLQISIDEKEQGWIRWRNGNQILIRMYYAC